jgi:checkpoint serine/threonine-protein kinase
VTVAHNGKKERVFVDLRAVYPSPDEPGTELSFEEVWAANRGWLDQTWEDEAVTPESSMIVDENSVPPVDLMKQSPPRKLAVHRDVVRLDENGAPIYPKEGKPRKKKVMEMNETQISK